jgi:hypothetical protein
MIMELQAVNIGISENLTFKSKMFPCGNIHKYTWKSTDGINPQIELLPFSPESFVFPICCPKM